MWPVSAARISAAACRPFAEPGGQAGIPGQLLRHGGLVGSLAGGQEPVGVGAVVDGAVATQQAGQVGAALEGGQGVRRPPVGPGPVRVGAVGEQQLDQFGRTPRPDRFVQGRSRRPVVVGIAAGIGTGLQQQAHALGVVEAERRGQRHLGRPGHVGGVAQQQPQALVVIAAEPGQVQVVIVGHGAALQQQRDDRRVGRAGYRAAQRRPAAARPAATAVGVGPGVQDYPGHGQQAAGPGRVEPVPVRGAGRVQRRPARPGVHPGGQGGVPGDLGTYPAGVAQDHRGGEVVAGQFGGGGQHPDRAAGGVADAGLAERVRLLSQVGAAGLDRGLEPGPAREAVLAGHGQLRAGQGRRGGNGPDAAGGRGVARLRGAQQVAGFVPQVVQAGAGRKIGHDVSFTGLRSARQADKGDRR